MEGRILALAAYWQSQLDILVVTAEFFPGGQSYNATTMPSSLVTVEPFCPGGLRRLTLNVRSPFIQEIARALHAGQHEHAVLELGKAMVRSASWPVQFMDGIAFNVHWRMARGLIGTPHELCVWPVPHQPVVRRTPSKHKPIHAPLSIWPRRICKVVFGIDRGGVSTTVSPPELIRAGKVWELRDEALHLEFQHLLERQRGSSFASRFRLFSSRRSGGSSRSETEENVVSSIGPNSALLTYAPSLPVFCISDVLVNLGQVPRHSALAEAADFLVRKDRLFALSLFFGVPLMDRTQTLTGSLRCAPLVRCTPSASQVGDFLQRMSIDSTSPETDTDTILHACRQSLQAVLLQRARQLWEMTETSSSSSSATNKCGSARMAMAKMYVAWSGGIDSTAVLCALLETAKEMPDRRRRQRLVVLLDDESIVENPTFHKNIVAAGKLLQMTRDDKPLSWHEHQIREENPSNILVTGELGDQLFGSDRCRAAFPDAKQQEALANEDWAKDIPPPPPPEFEGIFAEKGLDAPWQETVLPSLASVGLVAEGGFRSWKEWIAPQLKVAPFPIASTYDFLFWLNFSMKWQNVSLRCLHDGGEPLLARAKNVANLTGCIRHFFDDRDLECWSCVPDFHRLKFPDRADWKTYKEPLKYFIHQFDGDDDFYQDKMKVPSLCFGAPSEADSYVNRFHGTVVDLVPTKVETRPPNNSSEGIGVQAPLEIDPASRPTLLSWGSCGLSSPPDGQLEQLVTADTIKALEGYPSDTSDFIHVDPWDDSLRATSPFNMAPFFADEDERQRRIFNPVSKTTLVGKCASLLTPDLLRGRSFLDLGACLGASTHWALCQGASRATAVEIQESFCERAEVLLKRAAAMNCWPPARDEPSARFKVVCSGIREYLEQCADASHDVVLAAGLLHCFVDPIQILLEMARVASHAVLIEMTHPGIYMQGFLLDQDYPSDVSDIGTHTTLRSSVQPLQRRLEEGGLLQVAPRALVNMAGNDASFTGMAALPSRMAIESTLTNLGFKVSRVFLKEHPTENEEVLTYTGPRRFRALPTRYFLRCVRSGATDAQALMRSLESLVREDDQTKSSSWTKAKSWFSFGSSDDSEGITTQNGNDQRSIPPASQSPGVDSPGKKWEFDEAVALRFAREARCHIPDYEEVIDYSIQLLENDVESSHRDKRTLKIVDVGCATGHTLIKLLERGFENVHGVDVSLPMVEKAKENLQLLGYEGKAKLHTTESAIELPSSLVANDNELEAVFVNWTLQFVVQEADRKSLLRNIANSMEPGSLLVLTEKTKQDALTKGAYYDFKKRMGVSEEEIAVKEARLKGVLEPFDVSWYMDAMSECGFSKVCLSRAKYGFVTFVARRNAFGGRLEPVIPVDKFKTWAHLSESAKNVSYDAKENSASFQLRAWGSSTGYAWSGGSAGGTVYGYVYEGPTTLSFPHPDAQGGERSFTLYDGMYFACPGSLRLREGAGVLQLVHDQKAMFSIGGPVESQGRLPYIDGCTDSLLLSPAVKGAPCLNHLHFPTSVKQTPHTHPSGRSGVVVRGKGTCVCDGHRTPLEPGMAFIIPANVLHAFETTSDDQELDVIAFHPDSDFGPSFDDHPMVNRTMVDGVSASRIGSIRTIQRQT